MAHSRVAARFREPDGLVHHAHGLAHLGERGLGDLVGAAAALVQDVLDVVHILHELLAARADGGRSARSRSR